MTCRFGISVPQVFSDVPVDVDVLRHCILMAEETGLDSLWVQSQLVGTANSLDPIATLAFAAATTQRIRLGTSVLVATENSPAQLAKQIASLDHLSGGRLTVGIGIGAKHVTAQIGGLPIDRPVARLLETVSLFNALWAHDDVSLEGEFWQLNQVSMNPKPVQKPRPPLWLAGMHPAALRRSVAVGDGWMAPGAASIERFREAALIVAGLRTELGKTDFAIAKRMYVFFDSSRDAAQERVHRHFVRYGGETSAQNALESVAYGDTGDIARDIHGVIDAGAELVVLNPIGDHRRQSEEIVSLLQDEFGVGSLPA